MKTVDLKMCEYLAKVISNQLCEISKISIREVKHDDQKYESLYDVPSTTYSYFVEITSRSLAQFDNVNELFMFLVGFKKGISAEKFQLN